MKKAAACIRVKPSVNIEGPETPVAFYNDC